MKEIIKRLPQKVIYLSAAVFVLGKGDNEN